jgi:lysyl-tRNA synthetase class 2
MVETPARPLAEPLLAESERRAKMNRLRAEGVDPFPHGGVSSRTPIGDISGSDLALTAGAHPEHRYIIAGRLIARRSHGRSSFLELEDQSGVIQLYLRSDQGDAELYRQSQSVDLGDILEAEGCIYVTLRNQVALSVTTLILLTKSLRPPPDRHLHIKDRGSRYHRRELDLMSSGAVRRLFRLRAEVVEAVRQWLNEHGYVELETPILHSGASGASARPFSTHLNELNRDMSLRISSELFIKRCVVGGLEKVYDLGRCFRNEGISYRHNPEFTMLEWVASYSDYVEVASFTEEMIAAVARRTLGSACIECRGETIDLAKPWRRTTLRDAIREVVGVDIACTDSRELLALIGRDDDQDGWPQAVRGLYSKLVEPTLIQPTIVFDFPIEMSPLAKRHQREANLAEQFDAVIGGVELVTGNSELNDPDEQRRRFLEQPGREGQAGDDLSADERAYLRALESGLPPCAGGGMGLDRLLMILAGQQSLREVVLFPLQRDDD